MNYFNPDYTKEKITLLNKLAESHLERAELLSEIALLTALLADAQGAEKIVLHEEIISLDDLETFFQSLFDRGGSFD
ncbi:hypothetical protein ACKQTC_07195 [Peptococcus simiae]|uniref:Uncharacterized protein n=1 Tax=Peptococcus simiae TaxID=1643805 RepID=A0ABW9H0E5_9FIRM